MRRGRGVYYGARGAGGHMTDDNTNGIGTDDGKHFERGGDAASTAGARGAGGHLTDHNTNGIGNDDGKHIERGGDAASTAGRENCE